MGRIFPGQDQLRKQARGTRQDFEPPAFAVVQSPLTLGDCHGASLLKPGAAAREFGAPHQTGP